MSENDVLFALVVAATVVQVTRATYAYRASQRAADRKAEKEKVK